MLRKSFGSHLCIISREQLRIQSREVFAVVLRMPTRGRRGNYRASKRGIIWFTRLDTRRLRRIALAGICHGLLLADSKGFPGDLNPATNQAYLLELQTFHTFCYNVIEDLCQQFEYVFRRGRSIAMALNSLHRGLSL